LNSSALVDAPRTNKSCITIVVGGRKEWGIIVSLQRSTELVSGLDASVLASLHCVMEPLVYRRISDTTLENQQLIAELDRNIATE
jgi:hypothetical protein